MLFQKSMVVSDANDASLVAASLAGNRDAFGQIVSRYQSLVCSLAYSATGSLALSEDLAQETFVTAWKQLQHLQEPQKLRSWLCGIARNIINNFLRRNGREPVQCAEPLDSAATVPGSEPPAVDRVIQREEEAILWRSLERIPDVYREPLVLFYREEQSIARVAAQLELSEDAVKQRLSRGRKMLAEEVSAFVEGVLKHSTPGKAFTVGVLTALPMFTLSGTAATVGTAAAKGSTTAKAAGIFGVIGALLGPVLAIVGTWIGYRASVDGAKNEQERQYVRKFYRLLIGCIVGFFVCCGAILAFAAPLREVSPRLFGGLLIGLGGAYIIAVAGLTIWSLRVRRRMRSSRIATTTNNKPAYEYRSPLCLLGLPVIHIRIGGSAANDRVVKAWIAIGDCAVAPLFAFGGLAIAPLSLGGCAIGLLPFGGFALGVLALGGFSVGIWSFGGMGFGWEAYAGCAVAWKAAMGGTAIAHDFALGGIAQAAEANNRVAAEFIRSHSFFTNAQIAMRHIFWLHLLWVIPMVQWWRAVRRGKR